MPTNQQENENENYFLREQVKSLIGESVSATPGRLSEILVELSSFYATIANKLEDILIFRADRWMELRAGQKSDTSTDRMWDSTPEGKDELRFRSQLKYIEKSISSIKMRLRVKEVESFGRY